jgi:hypothetical protein
MHDAGIWPVKLESDDIDGGRFILSKDPAEWTDTG